MACVVHLPANALLIWSIAEESSSTAVAMMHPPSAVTGANWYFSSAGLVCKSSSAASSVAHCHRPIHLCPIWHGRYPGFATIQLQALTSTYDVPGFYEGHPGVCAQDHVRWGASAISITLPA